jgi:hypothetical protein
MPQISGSQQQDYSTKPRQAGWANEQFILLLVYGNVQSFSSLFILGL